MGVSSSTAFGTQYAHITLCFIHQGENLGKVMHSFNKHSCAPIMCQGITRGSETAERNKAVATCLEK